LPGNDEFDKLETCCMQPNDPRNLLALALMALSLSACATRNEAPISAGLSEDDDSYCRRTAGPAGSPQYVSCRKDRDVQRSDALTRADKKQRDLGEWMLNHPD
jgi:hypothetical protein